MGTLHLGARGRGGGMGFMESRGPGIWQWRSTRSARQRWIAEAQLSIHPLLGGGRRERGSSRRLEWVERELRGVGSLGRGARGPAVAMRSCRLMICQILIPLEYPGPARTTRFALQ